MKQDNVNLGVTFEEVIRRANQYLSDRRYSAQSMYFHNRMWRKLSDYCTRKGIILFDPQTSRDFLYEEGHIKSLDRMTKYEQQKYRIIRLLADVALSMTPLQKYRQIAIQIPVSFLDVSSLYQAFLVQKTQNERTIESKMSRIRVFFRFLDGQGTRSIDGLTFQHVLNFLRFLQSTYAPVAKSNILYTLRDFLRFAENQGMTPLGASKYVDTIYTDNDARLPSTFNSNEIMGILQSINRESSIGKRDYAILLIAIELGLRASDITRLRISDIHWEKSEIQFYQKKTGNHQVLPITEDICYAVADYLKNGRPDTECDKVFVKSWAPYTAITCSTALYWILNKHMKIACVDVSGKRHGMHALRHSLSARLLASGTPLPVITGILGHSSSQVTNRYLWMNTEQLREMSLEVPHGK